MKTIHTQKPVRTIAPATALLTSDEVKTHLRVDHDDEDDLIALLIDAATHYLDGYQGILGQALITQTWRADFADFPYTLLRLPLGPVQSIASIQYRSDADVTSTLDASRYRLATDARGPFIELVHGETWPTAGDRADAVSVTFVAGFGDSASDVPQSIRHAALLLIGHWYENREGVSAGVPMTEVPMAVNALLAPHRRVG